MKTAKIWQLKKIEFSQKANSFIYFLSHAFILKRFFHDDLVSEYDSKEGLALTIMSLNFLYGITKKVIYISVISELLGHDQAAFGIAFLLLTIAGTAVKDIIRFDETDYNNVILLRVNTTDYGHLLLWEYLLREGVLFLLGFAVAANIINLSFWRCLLLIPAYLGIHLFGEMAEMQSIEKNGYVINKNGKVKSVLMIICLLLPLALVAAVAYFKPILPPLAEYLLILAGTILGVVSGSYLFNRPNYGRIFRYNLSIENIRNTQMIVSDGRTAIDIGEMNDSLTNNEIRSTRRGYDFIFDAFKQRYRKNFRKDWIIQIGITVIVTVIGCSLKLFSKEASDGIGRMLIHRLLIVSYPIYFFSSTSKKFVMSCFLQIDSKLVNYNFFRNVQAVKKNYLLRLKEAFRITMVPTLILTGGLVLIYLFNLPTYKIREVAVIMVLPLILGTFFSVFHISAYYLFHPYDRNGVVVNKVYAVVDYLVYLFSYLCIDIDIELTLNVTAVIAAILAVLSVILYVIVVNYAPKHFRVR
ncbi:MAG: hypothetical protein IJS38_04705 [Erysipelotrichaceae bacterium]|nr:hypothetical protein [Erysipelotrichaceae bacterium]